MQDLLELVKWKTSEMAHVKERLRKVEETIAKLKRQGGRGKKPSEQQELDFDQMVLKINEAKNQAAQSEAKAQRLRMQISAKEHEISRKETMKSKIKQQIEIKNSEGENIIEQLREQLEGQQELMFKQQKHLNELQVNCATVEEELIMANRMLDKTNRRN